MSAHRRGTSSFRSHGQDLYDSTSQTLMWSAYGWLMKELQ